MPEAVQTGPSAASLKSGSSPRVQDLLDDVSAARNSRGRTVLSWDDRVGRATGKFRNPFLSGKPLGGAFAVAPVAMVRRVTC